MKWLDDLQQTWPGGQNGKWALGESKTRLTGTDTVTTAVAKSKVRVTGGIWVIAEEKSAILIDDARCSAGGYDRCVKKTK
jgi:hypothetical protein